MNKERTKTMVHPSGTRGPFRLELRMYGNEGVWELVRQYSRSSIKTRLKGKWWSTLFYTESRKEFLDRCEGDAMLFAGDCPFVVRLQFHQRHLDPRFDNPVTYWSSKKSPPLPPPGLCDSY